MTKLEQAIAEILDYPSVFMGGPSRQSLRKAEAIVAMLTERIATGQLVPAQVWMPIESAPKDGSEIIVWNDSAGSDETCPLCFNWNGVEPERGRICLYHAHGEGLSYGADGLNVAVWGGGWCDSWEDGGGSLPDWWFRADTEFEFALNPTHWMPLPPPPAEGV